MSLFLIIIFFITVFILLYSTISFAVKQFFIKKKDFEIEER